MQEIHQDAEIIAFKLSNWIAGEAHAPHSGKYIENVDPARSRVISFIPRSNHTDADEAVFAAQRAMSGQWGQYSPQQRADLLDRVAQHIEDRLEEFARAESLDTGKPLRLARTVDIPRAVANFRFFAGALRHDETGCQMMSDALNYSIRKPLGVVALITPWNLPLYLLSWKLAPAIAMGNAVVAKPSEMTPTTATLLADVFNQADAPAGIYNVIHGYGAEAGAPLVEHPNVSGVSFTGGTSTGERVAASAAPQFKKLSLELGGKNASVVFGDCDLQKTVEGVVRAAFLNQGQICLCGSRILVERSIYVPFVEAVLERVQGLNVGHPFSEGADLGALISLEHRRKVESYVQGAINDGGRVLIGGTRPLMQEPFTKGAWLSPTVIVDLDPSCAASMEEIFGPVVVIHPFDDEEEAIELANSVEYGLAGTVWTSDLTRAHRVAAALHTGMVWVNTWLKRDLRVPFGGVKRSGVEREGGRHSLEFYSELQNICIQL